MVLQFRILDTFSIVTAEKISIPSRDAWSSICTNSKCRRRSKKLYLGHQGILSCRKCLKLAYVSQNCTPPDRALNKKWALVHKLGADSDFITEKPKGMHRKTFDRIRAKIEALDDQASFGMLNQRPMVN